MNIQSDEFRPNWITSKLQKNLLEDEVDYMQYGYADTGYFNNFLIEANVRPSAWTKFPTEENPFGKYKFTSIEINFSQDQLTISR